MAPQELAFGWRLQSDDNGGVTPLVDVYDSQARTQNADAPPIVQLTADEARNASDLMRIASDEALVMQALLPIVAASGGDVQQFAEKARDVVEKKGLREAMSGLFGGSSLF